jgi:hypothetical protein
VHRVSPAALTESRRRLRTTGQGDLVAPRACSERDLEDGEQVVGEDVSISEDASDGAIIIVVVHPPEALQVLEAAWSGGPPQQ